MPPQVVAAGEQQTGRALQHLQQTEAEVAERQERVGRRREEGRGRLERGKARLEVSWGARGWRQA